MLDLPRPSDILQALRPIDWSATLYLPNIGLYAQGLHTAIKRLSADDPAVLRLHREDWLYPDGHIFGLELGVRIDGKPDEFVHIGSGRFGDNRVYRLSPGITKLNAQQVVALAQAYRRNNPNVTEMIIRSLESDIGRRALKSPIAPIIQGLRGLPSAG